MANEEKKYSLIDLDTGSAEEEFGVKTTRTVVDGEETIVVQSEPARDEQFGGDSASATDLSAEEAEVVAAIEAEAQVAAPERDHEVIVETSEASTKPTDPAGEDDEVPFKRMQSVIIICLIVIIVVFLVYFNFIR